jgi:TrwC relaxase
VTVFNTVLTDSGRIGALNLDRMAGRVKELGAVYRANVAARAWQLGIATVLDERTGAARLAAIPQSMRQLFSKRTIEAQEAAREFASRQGIDWDAITAEEKIALLRAGAAEPRQAKKETAEGLEKKATLRYGASRPRRRPTAIAACCGRTRSRSAPAAEPRHETAYRAALPLLAGELERRAVLDGQELREIAARALIVAGIGEQPGDDIDAVIKAFRERGVVQDGRQVALMWGKGASVRGKERWSVTTALHIDQERELIRLAKTASLDMSGVCRRHRWTAQQTHSSSGAQLSIRPPSTGRLSGR